jgi:hypothetical protein
MDIGDPFDLAHVAFPIVSAIASRVGCEKRRPICGRLGGELWILTDTLDSRTSDQEERMRLKIWKLVKEVERICTVGSDIRYQICQW